MLVMIKTHIYIFFELEFNVNLSLIHGLHIFCFISMQFMFKPDVILAFYTI